MHWIRTHISFYLVILLPDIITSQIYTSYKIKEKVQINSVSEADNVKIGLKDYDGGDYAGYGNGDYGRDLYYEYSLDKIEHEPVILECFTCHYSRMEYHEHGMVNCDEPFSEEGVPTVQCKGLCAVTKTLLGRKGKEEEEYMLIRSCLPNCKNIYDQDSSTRCCFGYRCNGGIRKSGADTQRRSYVGIIAPAILVSVYIMLDSI